MGCGKERDSNERLSPRGHASQSTDALAPPPQAHTPNLQALLAGKMVMKSTKNLKTTMKVKKQPMKNVKEGGEQEQVVAAGGGDTPLPHCPHLDWRSGGMVMTPEEERCELHLGLSVVKAYERNMLDWCGDSSDHSHSWLRSPPTCHTYTHTKVGAMGEVWNVNTSGLAPPLLPLPDHKTACT